MHVQIDPSWQQSLAGGFHRFRLQLLRLWSGPFVNALDLAVLHQDAARLNDASVAGEDTDIAEQERTAAQKVAIQQARLQQAFLAVKLIHAQKQKWRQHSQQPQLRPALNLFFLLPTEQLYSNKRREHRVK